MSLKIQDKPLLPAVREPCGRREPPSVRLPPPATRDTFQPLGPAFPAGTGTMTSCPSPWPRVWPESPTKAQSGAQPRSSVTGGFAAAGGPRGCETEPRSSQGRAGWVLLVLLGRTRGGLAREGRGGSVLAGEGGAGENLLLCSRLAGLPGCHRHGPAEPSRETSGRRSVLFLADIQPCPDRIWGQRRPAAVQGRDPGASSRAGEGQRDQGAGTTWLIGSLSPGCRRVPPAVRSRI